MLNVCTVVYRRRAIEARSPPPDSVASVVSSLQNQVKSITLCVTLNANTGKIVPVIKQPFRLNGCFIMLSGVKL